MYQTSLRHVLEYRNFVTTVERMISASACHTDAAVPHMLPACHQIILYTTARVLTLDFRVNT